VQGSPLVNAVGKGGQGQQVDAVAIFQGVQVGVAQGNPDHAGHAGRVACRGAHPQDIVIPPLEIQGMVLHEVFHDQLGPRPPVEHVADDVEMVGDQPFDDAGNFNDEMVGPAVFHQAADDLVVVILLVEPVLVFLEQFLHDVGEILGQGLAYLGAGVFGG